MYDYLEDIILEAPSDMDGEDVTPAISNLFQVNPECEKLDQPTSEPFIGWLQDFYMLRKEQDLISKLLLLSCVQGCRVPIRMTIRNSEGW